MNNCFKPGEEWRDTEGKLIQAHGGSVLYLDGKYYWYGENKEKTLPGSGIWHYGVKLYSSEDLYNWKDEGLIIKPSEDTENPFHTSSYMDRPHIIYNKKTKKFVMWMKMLSREYLADQYMIIATADKITDEFKIIKSVQPLGYSSGDFDLVVDEKTDKAYIYFDKIHSFKKGEIQHKNIVCAELTEDYTDLTGNYGNYYDNTPYILGVEAPAFFRRNDKMYMFLSRTTGYLPNPSEACTADNYFGPWERMGRTHEDKENLSFRSQISSVFKHPLKKDLYIALADRWLMNLPEDLPFNMFEIENSKFDPNAETLSDERHDLAKKLNHPDYWDLSVSRYVWLPVIFENDKPTVKWFDEWKWEDFE